MMPHALATATSRRGQTPGRERLSDREYAVRVLRQLGPDGGHPIVCYQSANEAYDWLPDVVWMQ